MVSVLVSVVCNGVGLEWRLVLLLCFICLRVKLWFLIRLFN